METMVRLSGRNQTTKVPYIYPAMPGADTHTDRLTKVLYAFSIVAILMAVAGFGLWLINQALAILHWSGMGPLIGPNAPYAYLSGPLIIAGLSSATILSIVRTLRNPERDSISLLRLGLLVAWVASLVSILVGWSGSLANLIFTLALPAWMVLETYCNLRHKPAILNYNRFSKLMLAIAIPFIPYGAISVALNKGLSLGFFPSYLYLYLGIIALLAFLISDFVAYRPKRME